MKTCILLMTIFIWSRAVVGDKRLIVYIDRVEVTEIGDGSPYSFSDIDITFNNTYGSAFNFDMFISRDIISSKMEFAVELVRCANKEALDSCEYFANLKPPNACIFLNAKNMAWNAITDSFTPVLRCPLRKGTYVGRDITFDPNLWVVFPIHEWYWKITVRANEGKLFLFALLAEFKFIPYRNRTV